MKIEIKKILVWGGSIPEVKIIDTEPILEINYYPFVNKISIITIIKEYPDMVLWVNWDV